MSVSMLTRFSGLSLAAVRGAATAPRVLNDISFRINGHRIQVAKLGEPIYEIKWHEGRVTYIKEKNGFGIEKATLHPENSSCVDPLVAQAGWRFAIAAFREPKDLYFCVKKLDQAGREALEALVRSKASQGLILVSKEVREEIQSKARINNSK